MCVSKEYADRLINLAYRRWINANIIAVEASRMQASNTNDLWKLEEQLLEEYTAIYNQYNPPIAKWWE